METILELNGLRCSVVLGCAPGEQDQQQDVLVSVAIHQSEVLKGCSTDSLSDTIDYGDIVRMVRTIASSKSFSLIEHLGHEIWRNLNNKFVAPGVYVSVKVVKIKPPIEGLEGGATFSIGNRK